MHAQSIAVMAGDGIGPEVMAACLPVLDAACKLAGAPTLEFHHIHAGAARYREEGCAFSDDDLAALEHVDAVLFGAMGLPGVRYPDGTEIAPQVDLRTHFELYAGVRPIRLLRGVDGPLSDARSREIDFVIVRESTEGLFASRGKGIVENDVAYDTMAISRRACERIFRFAFDLARERKQAGGIGLLTCVDKANVFRSFAFFRQIFDEISANYPDIRAEHAYVDAVALNLVRKPWDFDVLVTENMFGDILSDLGAALVGGMGMAPSADVGERLAVFQPCHGSAPDIAGQGLANPLAMILSGAMMLDWLSRRKSGPSLSEAAAHVQSAVERAIADRRTWPYELGGRDGPISVADTVIRTMAETQAGAR